MPKKTKLVTMGQSEIIRWLMPDDDQLRNFTGRGIWRVSVDFYRDTFDIDIRRDWWAPQHPSKYTKESIKALLAKGILIEDDLFGYALSAEYLEAHGHSTQGALIVELQKLARQESEHLRAAREKLYRWNQFVYFGTEKSMSWWHHNASEFEFVNWNGKLHGQAVDIAPLNTKAAIEDMVQWHEQIIQWIEHTISEIEHAKWQN